MVDEKWLHKFLRNVRFYLTTRNPPTVQDEVNLGYLVCLLELRELELSLDLTERYLLTLHLTQNYIICGGRGDIGFWLVGWLVGCTLQPGMAWNLPGM